MKTDHELRAEKMAGRVVDKIGKDCTTPEQAMLILKQCLLDAYHAGVLRVKLR